MAKQNMFLNTQILETYRRIPESNQNFESKFNQNYFKKKFSVHSSHPLKIMASKLFLYAYQLIRHFGINK